MKSQSKSSTSILRSAVVVWSFHAPGATVAGDHTFVPTRAQIEAIERLSQRPGARALTQSARYYRGIVIDGRQVVKGEILAPLSNRPAGLYLDRLLPLILDGGCSVINLDYEVATGALASRCTGLS